MKTHLFFVAAVSIYCFAASPIARAQEIKADTGGVAIGGNVISSTINIGVPAEQLAALVRQAGDLSETQKKLIASLEGELDLNRRQVHAALDILGEANVPPERLAAKLVEFAERFKVLQAAASARPGDGPSIAALKADVQKAIDAGELARADALLADVETEQRGALNSLAVNAADTAAQRGEVALTRLRYREAAMHFADAAAMLLQGSGNEDKRIGYLDREARALYQQGDEFGDNGALLSAIEQYKRLVALMPRERGPLQWATTQSNLGVALTMLGTRENGTAKLEEAVAAYREALKERTRERVPLDWAAVQHSLGVALDTIGERENGTAKREEAVAAYREALKEFTRERVPRQWAATQNNLGGALTGLGERENGTAKLEEAVAAYREALKEQTRERAPLDWATTQNNLGVALAVLGERENGTAKLEEAVAACDEALKARTRERVPLQWATTQTNLGVALARLGQRENGTAKLEEAVAAYREALKEQTRERVPLDWAAIQNNLGAALDTIGERENGTAKREEAVAAYREALKERTRERVPLSWAETQRNVGYVRFYQGDFAGAALELQEAVDGADAYQILWLYLARAREGKQDAKRDLEQRAAGLKLVQWPSPVIKLFLGQGTPEAMLGAAENPTERCEAQYYLGQWHLLREARANSIEALRNAAANCPKDFVEYAGALAELKRFAQ